MKRPLLRYYFLHSYERYAKFDDIFIKITYERKFIAKLLFMPKEKIKYYRFVDSPIAKGWFSSPYGIKQNKEISAWLEKQNTVMIDVEINLEKQFTNGTGLNK